MSGNGNYEVADFLDQMTKGSIRTSETLHKELEAIDKKLDPKKVTHDGLYIGGVLISNQLRGEIHNGTALEALRNEIKEREAAFRSEMKRWRFSITLNMLMLLVATGSLTIAVLALID